jgi:hypothetical protein
MFGEGHDESIVHRGLDEAHACQDMLERTPTKPSMLIRVLECIGDAIRPIVRRDPVEKRQGIPAAPRGT